MCVFRRAPRQVMMTAMQAKVAKAPKVMPVASRMALLALNG